MSGTRTRRTRAKKPLPRLCVRCHQDVPMARSRYCVDCEFERSLMEQDDREDLPLPPPLQPLTEEQAAALDGARVEFTSLGRAMLLGESVSTTWQPFARLA